MNSSTLLFVLCVVLCLGGDHAWASDPSSAPKQGAALLKTDIMGVFAHPDDETMVAATLAKYALGQGKTVASIHCTRGEGGGNMVGTQWGAALGVLREAELRDCLTRLGVRYCYFLDQEDFFYTESAAATLNKWGKEETLRRLVRFVRALRPDVIVTINPAPMPGQHGHHQAAGVLATEAFDAAADPRRFPEQLTDEGLSVWQVRKLYYNGDLGGTVATITTTDPLQDGKSPAQISAEALSNHRSQAFGNFANSPWLQRPQKLTLVKSVVPFAGAETDLLRSLPVTDTDAKPVLPPQESVKKSPITLRFVPRPAIAAYLRWAKEQRVEQKESKLSADVPVVAGEVNEIKLEITNTGSDTITGEVQFTVPAGWLLVPASRTCRVVPSKSETITLRVTPPIRATGDATLAATVTFNGERFNTEARAHPIPQSTVPRLKKALALETRAQVWSKLPAIHIASTNLAQGKTSSEADSSADFRLAHNGMTLFVDVEVKDDVVVSNIAPNDIRGHWRSDSVEICIDPDAGAENTLKCFKLAIFPFDTTGVVRGARDADAHQGPIEQTAPKTRIASHRTSDGYFVRAAIPFSEIGFSPKKSKRLGFNIIVYDGDKKDAALGENINKSRIAWSPRSGVQGRPEDWGRIDLE
ncbi:MAG: PIG-L family deacetylase [Verrucomicrobia bacterium]|nr:PIG-L family deacetylase [Verrucomicrobiota bacterium]